MSKFNTEKQKTRKLWNKSQQNQNDIINQEIIRNNNLRTLTISNPFTGNFKTFLDLSFDFEELNRDPLLFGSKSSSWFRNYQVIFEPSSGMTLELLSFIKSEFIYRISNVEDSDIDESVFHPRNQTNFVGTNSFQNELIQVEDLGNDSVRYIWNKCLFINELSFLPLPDFQVKLNIKLINPRTYY